MKKCKLNINVRKILVLLTIIFIICTLTATVFAEITRPLAYEGSDIKELSKTGIMGAIGEVAIKMLMSIVKYFVMFAMVILQMVFEVSGLGLGTIDDGNSMPDPSDIVFNTIPMLDPNFINPYEAPAGVNVITILNIVSKAISPIYYSSMILISGIFSVIALFIGIKLIISISPAEKAQYKSSVLSWITGLALLYSGHIIMSGILYMNEMVVATLYNAEQEQYIVSTGRVDLDALEWYDYFDLGNIKALAKLAYGSLGMTFGEDGDTVQSCLEEIVDGTDLTIKYTQGKGYKGLMAVYYHDMIIYNSATAALAVALMIGQTFALLILYVKRVVFVVALGLVYPFVIAVDTVKKVKGGKTSGLFEKWLKQFSLTVFMQSIHAFILFMLIKIVNQINIEMQRQLYGQTGGATQKIDLLSSDNGDVVSAGKLVTLMSLVEIAIISSLTKVENLAKEFAGIENSNIGDVKSSGAAGMVAFGAMRTATKNVKDNFKGTGARIKNKHDAKRDLKNFDKKNGVQGKLGKLKNKVASRKNSGKIADPKQVEAQKMADTIKAGLGDSNKASVPNNVIPFKPRNSAGDSDKAKEIQRTKEILTGSGKAADTVAKASGYNSPALNNLGMKLDRIADNIAKATTANKQGGSNEKSKYVVDPNIRNPKLRDYKDPSTGRSLADDRKVLADKYTAASRELRAKTTAAVASIGFVPTSIAVSAGATDNLAGAVTTASKMIETADAAAEALGRLSVRATSSGAGRTVKRDNGPIRTTNDIEDK